MGFLFFSSTFEVRSIILRRHKDEDENENEIY